MALTTGTRLGPYEILSPLGAGGMGEVYRAKDTRLGREVAVKVLPEHLSKHPEIKQRFEREARAVSSLNHPHICTLFDIGSQEGVDFLVMELLEGETLALRLKKGPMEPAEAMRVGIQIAGALEKAHRAGFIHRDLKPANIMLTKSGAKLLDFGLARSLAGGPVSASGTSSEPLSASPTVARSLTAAPTGDSPLTSQGAILGTFQYMSPEQLDGREADQRTDIFALGLVLYEMLTGRRAFEGTTQASLIAEIMKGEPRKASEIVETSPAALDRVIRTCLRKDPDERFQSAHDVKLQLEWIAESPDEAAGPAGAPAPARATKPLLRYLPWVVAALAAVVAMIGWDSYSQSQRKLADASRPVTFAVPMPAEQGAGFRRRNVWADLALSPDGRRLVFVAKDMDGTNHLWLREFDDLESRRIEGTDGAAMPFWSPDSRNIGFFAAGKVAKVAAGGGPIQTLCESKNVMGGTWNEQGVILLGGDKAGGGIMRVPAGGGIPEEITKVTISPDSTGIPETARHAWPVFLPGGEKFIYLQFAGRTDARALYMGSLDGGEPRKLLETGFKAGFIGPDWVIYVQRSSLMARRVDLDEMAMVGEPFVIFDGIDQAAVPGLASFSVSPLGHIAFRRSDFSWRSQLTWYSRDGSAGPNLTDEGSYASVSLSPDGRTASFARTTGESSDTTGVGEAPVDIWNTDLGRGIASRFTTRPGISDENPVWSPDGKRIAFASHQQGVASVYVRDASGAGEETLVLASDKNPHPIDWSPDGRYLLLHVSNVIGDVDLAYLDLTKPDAEPVMLAVGPGNQGQGQISPDGRWLAYASYDGEDPQVFVLPFPSGDGKWQISGGGGEMPRWRDDGRELYFVSMDGKIMAVEVAAGPEFHASAPVALFHAPILVPGFVFYGGQATYDVAPGGERFLIDRDLDLVRPESTIDVILNWPRPGGAPR